MPGGICVTTIPPAVIQRLPQYLSYVWEQKKKDARYVLSQEIAYALGLTSSTVRQDFTHLDVLSGGKLGYETDSLERILLQVLDMEKEKHVVIIGAGHLGRALALHGNLGRHGFQVRGILDIDSKVIGENVGSLTVQSMESLVDVVRDERVDIGIIAVPAPSAQEATDRLILAGVCGVLNLAPTHVVVPRGARVVDVRVVSSLLQLSCAMVCQSGSLPQEPGQEGAGDE